MTCIHSSVVGLCRQCEHDGPRVAQERSAELERKAQDYREVILMHKQAAEGFKSAAEQFRADRDRLAADFARVRKDAQARAAQVEALTAQVHKARWAPEYCACEGEDDASIHSKDTFEVAEACISIMNRAREALAALSQSCSEQAGTEPVSASGAKVNAVTLSGAEPPPAAGSPGEGLPEQTRGLVEYAALLRVAVAAERYDACGEHYARMDMRHALAELRWARAGKDGGSDE